MVAKLQAWLRTPAGRSVGTAFAVVVIGLGVWTLKSQFGQSDTARVTTDRMFIDAENGKPFPYTVVIGDTTPVTSPFSGKKTGYEAEKCYWTKEGQSKDEPTYVLVNSRLNKPGPTFCPDCGRLVVAHNPGPGFGVKPPPTQAEYNRGVR